MQETGLPPAEPFLISYVAERATDLPHALRAGRGWEGLVGAARVAAVLGFAAVVRMWPNTRLFREAGGRAHPPAEPPPTHCAPDRATPPLASSPFCPVNGSPVNRPPVPSCPVHGCAEHDGLLCIATQSFPAGEPARWLPPLRPPVPSPCTRRDAWRVAAAAVMGRAGMSGEGGGVGKGGMSGDGGESNGGREVKGSGAGEGWGDRGEAPPCKECGDADGAGEVPRIVTVVAAAVLLAEAAGEFVRAERAWPRIPKGETTAATAEHNLAGEGVQRRGGWKGGRGWLAAGKREPRSGTCPLAARQSFLAPNVQACVGANGTGARFGAKSPNACVGAEAQVAPEMGSLALKSLWPLFAWGTWGKHVAPSADAPVPLSPASVAAVPHCPSQRAVWHVVPVHGTDHFAIASHRVLANAGASRRFWDAYVVLLQGLDAQRTS